MQKKIIVILTTLAALLLLACLLVRLSANMVPDHPFFTTGSSTVIAHRGGAGLWPENTLYAFEHALALGVDVLEMDVYSSEDDILVVIHDETVDRTTNGNGAVQDLTWAEIQNLDAAYYWTADDGHTFPLRGEGIGVPTLAAVFKSFPDARMVIEIKQSQPSIVPALCTLVRTYEKGEEVIIASFHATAIRDFRDACPEVATSASLYEGLVFWMLAQAGLGRVYSPAAEALQFPEYAYGLHAVTPQMIRAAHGHNMQVHVWSINDTVDMDRLLGWGVDGIMTDYPDRLLTLLDR